MFPLTLNCNRADSQLFVYAPQSYICCRTLGRAKVCVYSLRADWGHMRVGRRVAYLDPCESLLPGNHRIHKLATSCTERMWDENSRSMFWRRWYGLPHLVCVSSPLYPFGQLTRSFKLNNEDTVTKVRLLIYSFKMQCFFEDSKKKSSLGRTDPCQVQYSCCAYTRTLQFSGCISAGNPFRMRRRLVWYVCIWPRT